MNLLQEYKILRDKMIVLMQEAKASKHTENDRDIYKWNIGDSTQKIDFKAGFDIPDNVLFNVVTQSIKIKADEDEPNKQDYIF